MGAYCRDNLKKGDDDMDRKCKSGNDDTNSVVKHRNSKKKNNKKGESDKNGGS
ncbi:hypothetical protein [Leptospira weilii]|uniref:hypothetical protein n=1 Tax=Leptospira weilii TaxID=28184 RepID=UPI000A4BCAB8|nr:hypothetical protein [Leptospira weilii]